MKAFLILALAILVPCVTVAQQSVDVRTIRQRNAPVDLVDHHFTKQLPTSKLSHHSAESIVDSSCGGGPEFRIVTLGSSFNIYSILENGQNQVVYSPDINTVAFVHRQNVGTVGGSGGLSFDISTDGGQTWPGQNLILTPAYNSGASVPFADVIGNRYPNITIYNPAGNTDPANANVVAVGPALSATTAYFGNLFAHSAQIPSGAGVCENYFNTTPGTRTDFHPYGLVNNPNGDVWFVSSYYDGTNLNYDEFYLYQGMWDSLTSCVNWTSPTTITPNYHIDPSGANTAGFGWNMAFSPDGQTGYMVHLGSENSNVFFSVQPNVWKTTNGGSSWNKLPDFDFRGLSAFAANLTPTLTGGRIPLFSSIDMVVDANDRMQIFCDVNSRVDSSASQLYFIWLAAGASGHYALSTSDGTDWDAELIASNTTTDGIVGAVGHTPRTQMARTEDGSKIFYAWTESDSALVSTNNLPNILIEAVDVLNPSAARPRMNVTKGTAIDGIVYFPTVAPIVIESGTMHDYEVAVVFAELSSMSDITPVRYHFINPGFNEGDFACTTSSAPTCLSSSVTGVVELSWEPITQSVACKVRGRKQGTVPWRTLNLVGTEPNLASIPIGVLDSGATYNWQVRCACSISPPSATGWSDTASFDVVLSPRYAAAGSLSVELQTVEIYPVPADTRLSVHFQATKSQSTTLVVSNHLGQVVHEEVLHVEPGDGECSIETKDWPAGVYILHASGLVKATSFVVNH